MDKNFLKGFIKAAQQSRDITMSNRSMGPSARGSAFSNPSKPKKNDIKMEPAKERVTTTY